MRADRPSYLGRKNFSLPVQLLNLLLKAAVDDGLHLADSLFSGIGTKDAFTHNCSFVVGGAPRLMVEVWDPDYPSLKIRVKDIYSVFQNILKFLS